MKLTIIAPNMTEVTTDGGTVIMFSYETPVACRREDGAFFRTSKFWSKTTSRHVARWLASRNAKTAQEREQSFFDSLT